MAINVNPRHLRRSHLLGLMGACLIVGWATFVAHPATDAIQTADDDVASTGGQFAAAALTTLATEPNDEIHSSLGDSSDQMWLYWRGPDQVVHYGLDATYGQTATASRPVITPKDLGGHWQVKLAGLAPDTTYHYKIGASGLDHTFQTAPTGDFVWEDIGNTATTYSGGGCSAPWMSQVWQQIADDHPSLVTHGGDISYANQCGLPSVHQFWNDIEPLATQAAMQFAWGNHESAGRDSIANYKGRFNPPHAQTIPFDTPDLVTSPGCPSPSDPAVNGCRGNDWGYFTAGHVLFITYPELWSGAIASWHSQADALMEQAENNPNIYFIVTVGHRPAYQNGGTPELELQAILDALADKYSPAARPDGKYVLNVAHHIHNGQVLGPHHGLLHVINGGGGREQTKISKLNPGTSWLTNHLSHLRATVTGDEMKLEFVCGPVYPPDPDRDACTLGDVLHTRTLTGYQGDPLPVEPRIETTLGDGGLSSVRIGDQLTYRVSVQNARLGTTASGVRLTMTLPPHLTVLDPGGATVATNTLTWDLGDVGGGQSIVKSVLTQLTSGNDGDSFDVSIRTETTDGACAAAGSVCTAYDRNLIVSPTMEYVANTGFETTKKGWTGLYNSVSKTVRYPKAQHDGAHSLKIIRNTTTPGAAGVVSKPSWVPSTTADSDFTASAWVRGQKDARAQTVIVQINEVTAAGVVVGSNSSSLTFSDLTWHRVEVPYRTIGAGNHLDYVIYSPDLGANAWLLADTVSLIGPRP
jgi:uncharacterized repeat protein (TIGR01451 family)